MANVDDLTRSGAPLNGRLVEMEVEAVQAAHQNKREISLWAPLPVDKVVFSFNICSFEIKRVSPRRSDIDFAQVLQKLKAPIVEDTTSALEISKNVKRMSAAFAFTSLG